MVKKTRISVHKFTSCDGCQLAFLNLGGELIKLADVVDFVHFAELGPVNPEAKVEIAFVEGSITTPQEQERIKKIRQNSNYLITIGACATAGGIQALRNFAKDKAWIKAVYADEKTISSLDSSTAISDHVKVDLALWGCPVNGEQILAAIRALLRNTLPKIARDSVCMSCKRQNYVCVMVAKGLPCLGPVTQTGCGALCPSANRGCYACYGPSDTTNTESLINQLANLGLDSETIARRFLFINNQASAFKKAGLKERDKT